MRIAVVHSFYASDVPSGENAMVREQVDALAAAGHDVLLIARHTDEDSRQLLYQLRSAGRVITGRGPDPMDDLRTFAPDVIHVHNLFPNFGTRWLRTWPGPVVATLHNFRPICANGLLYRDGHYCEECPTQSNSAAVRHGCYHGSHLASIPLALRNARGPASDDVLARADALVCLSTQSAETYRRLTGLNLPIHVIPNGIDLPIVNHAKPNGRWLVVSRLTPEKGVSELTAIWPSHEHLDVIGTGPEASAITALDDAGIHYLGSRDRREILDQMPSYLGLVFPSRCMEMQPTVLVEALASGLPIVALAGSAGEATAALAGAGAVYSDAATLEAALTSVRGRRGALSDRARRVFSDIGDRRRWSERLVALYQSLLEGRGTD